MKGRLNKHNKHTVWYENDAPVREYLDRELSGKADPIEKNPHPVKLSWLEIINKPYTRK